MKTPNPFSLVASPLVRCLVAAVFMMAAFAPLASAEQKKAKMLVLTQSKGFMHDVVNRKGQPTCLVERVMAEVGKESGLWECECTQDASIITADKLKDVDVLFFYTTGGLPIEPANWEAVLKWVEAGHAFLGYHSATDTAIPKYTGPMLTYTQFINGKFGGHPWGQGTPLKVINHDLDHPATKMFGAEYDIKEEIYQYPPDSYDPKAVRVLLSMQMTKTNLKMPYHVPISWCREIGKGRLFYNNFGHTDKTWQDKLFQEHLIASFKWAMGITKEGSAVPNPEVQAVEIVRGFLAGHAKLMGRNAEDSDAVVAKLQKSADKAWFLGMYDQITKARNDFQSLKQPKKGELLADVDQKANDAKQESFKKLYTEILAKAGA